MPIEELILNAIQGIIVYLLLAVLFVVLVLKAVRIVSQSEQHVIERFSRLHSMLGPRINIIIPFLDRVAHKISILER